MPAAKKPGVARRPKIAQVLVKKALVPQSPLSAAARRRLRLLPAVATLARAQPRLRAEQADAPSDEPGLNLVPESV
jgi:hypothetical protein